MLEKILIAHQRGGFAKHCKTWLEAEGYEVEIAVERERAFEIVDQASFDLALVSSSFPDVGGLDFVRGLKDRGWDAPVILFSEQGFLPVQLVSEAIHLNVTDVIEEPEQPDELLASVRSSATLLPIGSVRGNLRTLALPSLISLLCNEGRTVSLRIWHNGSDATVFFERGNVVHAMLDDKEGEEAVYDALGWEDGHFAILTGRTAPEQTIHTSWSGLVLEGLSRIDEQAFDQEQLTDAQEPALTADGEIEPVEVGDLTPNERLPGFELDDEVQSEIESCLTDLYHELVPRCVLLTNHSGRLLHFRGDIERNRALSLSVLAAGSFSATSEIAEIVAHDGEERQFEQSLQEGADFDFYSAQAGEKWILAVAFDPKQTNLGLARQLTLRAAAILTDLSVQLSDQNTEAAQQVSETMDDLFRQEVGDAIEDLFA